MAWSAASSASPTTSAAILLLTDAESRTPVLLVRTNGRAILSGDGGDAPKLDYVRTAIGLKEGDRVLTSGDGGVFPRGLPVGTVVQGLDGGWRVALDSRRRADRLRADPAVHGLLPAGQRPGAGAEGPADRR